MDFLSSSARNRTAGPGRRHGNGGRRSGDALPARHASRDLTPGLTLSARDFAPKAQALVLNEVAIDAGITRADAFGRLTGLPGFIALAKTSVPVWMPRLFAAGAIEVRHCRFFGARDGNVTPPLGMFDAARLRAWLDAMDRRCAGISSWIP